MGVEYGTLIGVGVDLIILLYPMARPGMEVINPSITESSKYDEEEHTPKDEDKKVRYCTMNISAIPMNLCCLKRFLKQG